MPASPYETTLYPPIEDLRQAERDYHRLATNWGEDEDDAIQAVLDTVARLFRHSDFLENKLRTKKREFGQLAKENNALKKEIGTFKEESQTQRMEITALKSELEKGGAVTGTDEQLGSESDDIGVESNSRDVSGGKPEEGDGSVNPRKRDAEVDNTIDGRTTKKRRVANARDNSMVSEGAADNSLVSGK